VRQVQRQSLPLPARRTNSSIDGRYLFDPSAMETLGVYSTSARQLLSDLGRKISQSSGKSERRAFSFKDVQC